MDAFTFDKLNQQGVSAAQIKDMDLSECNLSSRDLVGCSLREFIITKTNFEKAMMIGCDLRGLQFVQTNCVSVQFMGSDLRGANLSYGYFHNADFRGADLRGAILIECQCNECDFSGADLRGATLGFGHYNSDFRGADLRGTMYPDDGDFQKLNCDTRGALIAPRKLDNDQNKRRFPRVRLTSPLQVFNKTNHRLLGGLIDLSRQGFKLISQHQIPIGELFSLHVLVPGGEAYGARLDFEAKSMWCRHDQSANLFNTGFQIQSAGTHTLKLIETILQATGKPEIPLEEDPTELTMSS